MATFLFSHRIQRNECGPDDVEFDVKFCGICHTDVHFANNDLGTTNYPCVPGHELAGIVTKVKRVGCSCSCRRSWNWHSLS